jgi:hypothetical protein
MLRISRIQLDGAQEMPRCITSNQVEGSNWQGIIVNAVVLQSLEKNGVIYNYIHRTYGEKLKVKRTSGKTPEHLKEAGQFRLAKIEW